MVAPMASAIPKIPRKLPRLAVEGLASPLSANIKQMAAIKYKNGTIVVMSFAFLLFFIHTQHALRNDKATKNIDRGYKNRNPPQEGDTTC